ncbi:uncharacterized protein [Maniola hyperantus]|uniref:uncharacterized protein n=1 Tax=Aphantopus hyperantus TaxID=2795564 RepID=UPI00374A2453
MGTDEFPSVISAKSTSCAEFKMFADAGVSTSNLVDRASYNGGSYNSQNSFCTVIHPECSSVCINTDVEVDQLDSKSVGTGVSFDSRFKNRNKSTNDCHVQCSESLYRTSNETWDSSRYVARIGRSRLMSVRMLSDSVTETATQAQQPVFQCAETNTAFEQKISASVFTSRYAIGEPLRSSVQVQPKDTEHILTCHCANTACRTKPIDAKERRSQAFAPVRNDVASKTNSEVKSVSQLTTRNEAAKQAASNAEPNFVISSNLNATKWMKGCTKETDKDVQFVTSISGTMVTEDRVSLDIATSKDRQSIGEIKKLSEVVINHQPAVACGTGSDIMTTSKTQSASVLTSRHILPNQPRCGDSSKDCIFVYDRPRCIVHSFRADAVVQTEILENSGNSSIELKPNRIE